MSNNWKLEEIGNLAVQKAAIDNGFIYRDQTKHDFGIDLHFELTDNRGDATGRLIAVQVKTGESYFTSPNEDKGWWYYISDRHKNYWLNHSLPVVLALHNEASRQSYWQRVTADKLTKTKTGGQKLLIPSDQSLDKRGFGILANLAKLQAPTPSGALSNTPRRHEVVLQDAMHGAARDDALTAFEFASKSGKPVTVTDTLYHMGDPMGRYVLTAYREFGAFVSLTIVVEHLTTLNSLLEDNGYSKVAMSSLLAGLAMALPGDAHPDEVKTLKNYIYSNADAYWGSPL